MLISAHQGNKIFPEG